MEIVTVSSKGQLAIPKAIREELGLAEGTKLTITVQNGSLVLHKTDDWRGLYGLTQGFNLLSDYEEEKAREKIREDVGR